MRIAGKCIQNCRIALTIIAILFCTVGTLGIGGLGLTASKTPKSKFDPKAILSAEPLPAMLEDLQRVGISLATTNSLIETQGLRAGETANALVTLHEKGLKVRQWLIHLEVLPGSTNNAPKKRAHPLVIYSSTGSKFEFFSAHRSMNLRTIGPYQSVAGQERKGKKLDLNVNATVDEGFLALGLDRAAATDERLTPSAAGPIIWFSQTPPSTSECAKGKTLTKALNISLEDERALCASGPALMSYLMLTQNSPGLQDIYYALMDWGSIWSVISRGGVRSVNLAFEARRVRKADAKDWNLPLGQTVHYLPVILELNKRPALDITLVVTNPKPPFLICGGIIGLMATKPGDANTLLTLRILGNSGNSNRL